MWVKEHTSKIDFATSDLIKITCTVIFFFYDLCSMCVNELSQQYAYL